MGHALTDFLKYLILFQIIQNRFYSKVISCHYNSIYFNGQFILEFGQFISVT